MKMTAAEGECSAGYGIRKSLSEIVDDYRTTKCSRFKGRTRQQHKREELKRFEDFDSLHDAIRTAASSLDACGRRCAHQRRITKTALDHARKALLGAEAQLQDCSDFDELHAVIHEKLSNVKGVGPLYVYDVALRIGANRGYRPRMVYLHAGTACGAKKLGLHRSNGTLGRSHLPEELRRCEPLEIEDILCIYKDWL